MKMILLTLSLILLPTSISAQEKTPKELAIEKFIDFQNKAEDPSLLNQIENLRKKGYTEKGETDAIYLYGDCGFFGCDYNFLVTTNYSTIQFVGVDFIAAIVHFTESENKVHIGKFLSEEERKVLTY